MPIPNEEIVDIIAERAAGVPLYLDLCVDIYEAVVNSGTQFDIDLLKKKEGKDEKAVIIDRYIRHLDADDKYAVKVLSILRSFHPDFAIKLLKKQNLIYHNDKLKELLDKSIILLIDEKTRLYKMDESVMLHLHKHMDYDEKRDILSNILDCISDRTEGRYYAYLAGVLEKTAKEPIYLEGFMEKLLSCIDYYASVGYCNELHSALGNYIDSEDERLRTLALFEEIIYQRKCGSLKTATNLVENGIINQEEMGVWYYMYRFLCIQIRHLQGAYDTSIVEYRKLLNEMNLIRFTIPPHIYNMVAMKYADLLFLKGQFEESMKLVDDLLGRTDTPLEDKVELLRIKGHINRFNGKYKEATIIYKSALTLVRDKQLIAYEGKLFNNMTEVTCTVDPAESLKWYAKSVDANTKCGNEIELGKSQAAVSIAYSEMGDYANAEKMAKFSIATAEKTGYQSGKAFALKALYLMRKKSGDDAVAKEVRTELEKLLSELGVYAYILQE